MAKLVDVEKPSNSVVIRSEASEERREWLSRSCIGVVRNPVEADMVATKLAYPGLGISRIRDIGKFKFLVTFATVNDTKKSFEAGRDIFLEVFDEINPWTKEEMGQTRRVWLDCHGVPLHG